ncbi:inositol polyphosphate multikinase-like [Hydractinia symbiolongicarpus]|uniref:inositol polyphosphate multikinase-like n=1 Tax=Hydractinia symbiolongicarpus TaxID=13093 RepID=UPI002550050A|nr:inositol polyphosphate multikinase-like [Hydractinia symbiolongicarpus]
MPSTDMLASYDSFDGQIGGHKSIKGVKCMVADKTGHLFKYIDESGRGENEDTFYKTVFSIPDFIPLREFVPKSYGLVNVVKDGKILKYLKLENLLYGLHQPNIIDIKIGRVTHDPFASKEKIEREETKYTPQKVIGFRMSGLKVYNSFKEKYHCYQGPVFRSCTCFDSAAEKTVGYLKKFFGLYNNVNGSFCDEKEVVNHQDCLRCGKWLRRYAVWSIVTHMIEDLEKLIQVLKKQKRISFYASSILLAFDSEKLDSLGHCNLHEAKTVHYYPSLDPALSVSCVHVCSSSLQNVFTSKNESKIMEELSSKGEDMNLTRRRVKKLEECVEIYRHVQVPYIARMIDFGHTYIDLDPGHSDTNYLYGLASLINFLKIVKSDIFI